ncbi:MAG: hypothetical protein HQL30_11220 [Candidatus Omnitrophica bacterium]|nr:hypothetical protein [Candidatus Omnitrophota bacterium]
MPFISTFLFYTVILSLFGYLFKISSRPKDAVQPGEGVYFKKDLVIALGVYTLFPLVMFFPILGKFNSGIIGYPEDPYQHLWDMWWAIKAVQTPGISLGYTNSIFYPEGTSLLFHAFSFYNLVWAVILSPFLSLAQTYNFQILSTFVLSGAGAFLLVKHLVRNSFAAIVGGFIFAFNPSHYTHALQQIEIATIQFIPLFVLFYIKSVKGQAKKDLVLASVFFMLNAASGWYNMFFSVYFVIFAYIYVAVKRRRFIIKDVMIKSAVVVASGIAPLVPWFFSMITLVVDQSREVVGGGHGHSVTDVLALFVPYLYHWLGGHGIFHSLNIKFSGSPWEKAAYLGLGNILVLVVAGRGALKSSAKYLLGALSFLVLSFGINLHILGQAHQVVLPYTLIQHIPFFRNVRMPVRAMVFVYLFWAVAVAFGLRHILFSRKNTPKRTAFLSALVLFIFADFTLISGEIAPVGLPSYYSVIMHDKDDFGIFEFPTSYAYSELYMMYQTFHGIPIIQGNVARKTSRTLSDDLPSDYKSLRERLIRDKVKYIIIRGRFLARGNTDALGGKTSFDDKVSKTMLKLKQMIAVYSKIFRRVYGEDDCFIFRVY